MICSALAAYVCIVWGTVLVAQEPAADSPARGSLVEDRAARKLVEAGDSRFEADEFTKAVEVWQSVIERYPRSRVRFEAHMRLGNYLLTRERAYDRARIHFEAVAAEENRDQEQRAEATLKLGVCFYEARNYGKTFSVMRDVIEKFPVSPQVNQAYYYIGLGHFQLGHYSRAIGALEKVGTALSGEAGEAKKVEAGKRLFLKIEDADLAVLEPDQPVKVKCETAQGDVETVECFSVGRNVRVVLGSILTVLGKPQPNNGLLEVRGDEKVKVTYIDSHTADRQFDRPLAQEVAVVGDAVVKITDGAFSETLRGIVLGGGVNIEITDADHDLSDKPDTLKAVVAVYREKTTEELDAEAAAAAAKQTEGAATTTATLDETQQPQIDRFKEIDRLEIVLTEVPVKRDRPLLPKAEGDEEQAPAEPQPTKTEETPADDGSVHSGVFRAVAPLIKADAPVAGDDKLQALPGQFVHVTYLDERHMGEGTATVVTKARTVEGNLGGVRVTRAEISDQELRVKTQLKTANALTAIGNRYKEFGLKSNAEAKYQQALGVCEEISDEARKLGGRLLEETYVQLWQIYFEMDKLELAAAMCQRLQREFPSSGFVDDALLQLADVTRKQGQLQRAIGIYNRLVNMPTSLLRGEAQYGIAECYEEMAKQAPEGPGAAQLYDRAFQEYKKVFDSFPESGRVGEAVAKMANYYYQQKDYARAIDTFETVLTNHPDAKFLDVILFNYGRCLYRMERKGEARRQFDQLIAEFPESPLASDAKKISDALAKAP
jgi:tetratricopeptide (TPR) repeat protein